MRLWGLLNKRVLELDSFSFCISKSFSILVTFFSTSMTPMVLASVSNTFVDPRIVCTVPLPVAALLLLGGGCVAAGDIVMGTITFSVFWGTRS